MKKILGFTACLTLLVTSALPAAAQDRFRPGYPRPWMPGRTDDRDRDEQTQGGAHLPHFPRHVPHVPLPGLSGGSGPVRGPVVVPPQYTPPKVFTPNVPPSRPVPRNTPSGWLAAAGAAVAGVAGAVYRALFGRKNED